MGTTNWGTQTISIDYAQAGTSQEFNKINFELLPPGIYKGGLLSKKDANTVYLSPFTCYIKDDSIELGVRVSTLNTIEKTISEATPYIILQFSWNNVVANYLDVFAKAKGDIIATDIIVGKGDYQGGVLQDTFLYDERTITPLAVNLSEFPDAANSLPFLEMMKLAYNDTDPTGTKRLNYDGHFHATKVFNVTLGPSGKTGDVADFHYDAVDPTGDKRLNYNGYFYATKVFNAVWGDLGEYFLSDQKEYPGRIYSIGNNGKIELTKKQADKKTIGVCTDSAGYILKSKYKDNGGILISLSGTVRVWTGKNKHRIKKGDLLISDKNGCATRANIFDKLFKSSAIIGKALENGYNKQRILMLVK